jgi:predicted nucleic-acid-binding protein
MKALDTNVLVRLLLADDSAQLSATKKLLSQAQELVWVLEANDYTVAEVQHALELLLCLPNFKPANVSELRQALVWYGEGMDFAEALHLALRDSAKQLLTFDKGFIKSAKRQGLSSAGLDWVVGV